MDKVIYDHTVESMAQYLAPRAPPGLREGLASLGVDLEAKRQASMSLERWRELIRLACDELYPGQRPADAMRELGISFIDVYFGSLMGRAVAAMMRMLGPRRAFTRATQNFRSANNFTETEVTEQADGHFELWMNDVDDPHFTCGILARAIAVAGGQQASADVVEQDGTSCRFAVRWETAS